MWPNRIERCNVLFAHVDVDHPEGRDVAEVRDGLPYRVVRRLQAELNQLAVAHCQRRKAHQYHLLNTIKIKTYQGHSIQQSLLYITVHSELEEEPLLLTDARGDVEVPPGGLRRVELEVVRSHHSVERGRVFLEEKHWFQDASILIWPVFC